MPRALVQTLPDGPLDIVGDVHGEWDALAALLARLRYRDDGSHADGRRLMFVGDLCDRGPDSPRVLRFVQPLVEAGQAYCVLGNHKLNLLRHERKHGNHWFYGLATDPRHPEFGTAVSLAHEERPGLQQFLDTLPLALERADLRVVHAAWIGRSVERLRHFDGTASEAYAHYQALATDQAHEQALERRYEEALTRLGDGLRDPARSPGPLPALGAYDEHYQMANPVRVLTSGVERAIEQPFFAAGKWRFVTRVKWWSAYDGPPVVFGHYWRWWDPRVHAELSKGEPHLFDDDPVGPVMAEDHRAFCVDFSVGARFKERARGRRERFHGRLGALRWPERELVYDGEPAHAIA